MNKALIGAIAIVTLAPAMIFASSDDVSGLPTGKRMMSATGIAQGGSGMIMDGEIRALHMAMAKLTVEQRKELAQMIRTYIESKGITIPPIEAIKETRKEIKEVRKQTKEEIKALREKQKAEIKTKREELKNKIKNPQTGTATGVVITGTVSM
jgi:molecular chaperone DnaK (HSP70)